jgi:TPP-dependent pyruvate/acetoin dehydrogenase alpha subunit
MTKDEKLGLLSVMYRIRLFEERTKKMYKQNRLAGNFMGALHTYIGQEAIAAGVCACLGKDDYIFSTHRGHGHFIARGGELNKTLAELQGKETGYSRGFGGSMHLFDVPLGFMGGNGIVGGGIPLALGAAFSASYRGTDQVAVCFFGDGAAGQGTFHESLNLASLWKLPVVYVCENNCYAVTTSVRETVCVGDIACRAAGYGMCGAVVDGNDVLAVQAAAGKAVARARAGDGPSLLECKTYRIDPHCMVLPESRSQGELEEWKAKDPIEQFERRLLEDGPADAETLQHMKEEVSQELDEAERFAMDSPFPRVDEFRRSIAERGSETCEQ